MMTGRDNREWMVYVSLIAMSIIWGGSWIAAKIIVAELDPFIGAFLRNLLAAIVLVPLLVREGKKARIGWKDWPLLIFQGLTGVFIQSTGNFLGMASTTAINGSLINASGPVLIALLSGLLLSEKLAWPQRWGFILALLGVFFIITRGSLSALSRVQFNSGDLIVLGGTAGWALYSVAGRITTAKHSPLAVTAYSCLCGAVLSTMLALPRIDLTALAHAGRQVWLAAVFLGVVSSALGSLIWFQGIRVIGASRTAIFQYLIPPATAVLATFILGERVQFYHLIGAGLVLTGVYVATQAGRRSFWCKASRQANLSGP